MVERALLVELVETISRHALDRTDSFARRSLVSTSSTTWP